MEVFCGYKALLDHGIHKERLNLKIVITQQISATGVKEYTKVARTFESYSLPNTGHKITDPAFGDMLYYEVEDVMIDYAADECLVALPPVTIHSDDAEDLRDAVREYESHGWTCTKPV